MTTFRAVLPFPPSLNSYYSKKTVNKGARAFTSVYVNATGKKYRRDVGFCVKPIKLGGRLTVTVELFPPDRRIRDLDNYLKCLLDALTHGGVWHDDSQIDELILKRRAITKGGGCVVSIRELDTVEILSLQTHKYEDVQNGE